MAKKGSRKKIDWESLEKDWRTGQFSNLFLGEKYGVSEAGIRKNAKKYEWKKDLVEQYQKGVEHELVRTVDSESTNDGSSLELKSLDQIEDDKKIVDKAVKIGVEVVRQHRKRVKQLTKITDELTRRLGNDLFPLENNDDPELGTLEEVHGRSESHTDIAWKLSKVISETVKLERQAFNLDAKNGDPKNNKEIDIEERIKANMRKHGLDQ